MKMLIVSVWDNAMQMYARPFFAPSEGVAIRSFCDEVKRGGEDNQMSKHPADFSLHALGSWNEETGIIEPTGPRLLIEAAAV